MNNKEALTRTDTGKLEAIIAKPIVVETPYDSLISTISNINFRYNAIGSNLQHLANPIFNNGVLGAVNEVQKQFNSLHQFPSILSNIAVNRQNDLLELTRGISLGLVSFSNINNINHLSDLAIKNNSNFIVQSIWGRVNSNLAGLNTKNLASFGIENSIAKAIGLSLISEKSLYQLGTSEIGKLINLSEKDRDTIVSSTLGTFNSYSELINSFTQNPVSYIEIEPLLNKNIPVSTYTTTNLLETITIEEEFDQEKERINIEIQYENEISLSSCLPLIDKGLLKMWQGAVEALRSDNPDKIRHFITSIRELYTHILHKLAPDESIKNWTTDSTFFDKGKPTRKARLRYILRDISNNPMQKFIEKDVETIIELINIFQQGTHVVESSLMPNHLIAIKAKAETVLKYLLEIEFFINSKNKT